jgi:CheY-like chemotaxis protein
MARVLFVEDEPWLGELYTLLLRKEHEVVWCRDGYDAVAHLDQQKPDVIVLDIMLPWVNGIQLLHELASYSDTAIIPVVLFSAALPEPLDQEILRAYGVVAALDKATTKPKQVLETIRGVVKVYADYTS